MNPDLPTTYELVTAAELHTILDFVRWAATEFENASIFYGHGTDNAWDEATHLIMGALKLPLDAPVLSANLLSAEKQRLVKLIQLRTRARIPVPYLIHQAWFAGLSFYVDTRVLIPRSPLAEIIEQHFAPWLPEEQEVQRILDIGTGSACIACLCAIEFPEAEVDAVDISADALAVAAKNVARYDLTERVHLIQSNVYSNLSGKKYDIIITNPPYVDAAEMAALPPEYLHEPHLGLASGADGLDCARVILRQAKQFLQPHGLLVLEVGFSAEALVEAFPDLPFTWVELERGGEGVCILNAEDL